ncbi:hypothetical protein, partial [Mucilaginibacter sp.]
LKNVIKRIPSNKIVFKKLPGSGATTLEIETEERNSIAIEPNVPVIQGKCKKYNTTRKIVVMGVYEGKTEEQIIDYLLSDVTPKKLIVTPESFKRVRNAIIEVDKYNLYNDFFLLFDECERTIQDVNYRADIVLPMMDFFKFKNKAFISATPIIPSDPRFIEEGFEAIYIEPDYDYRQDLQLISTNNTIFSFQQLIKDRPRDKYFIFFNSTDSIAQLITALNLKNESAIFCAKESKQKLKVNDFTHVYTSLEPFRKYNFFTSRFFSAVDIEYERYQCDPTIIMITDLVAAQHSMIDPLSEAIQIVGRFRQPEDGEIKKEIIHITNYDPILSNRSREETIKYVHEKFIVYEGIKRFLDASTEAGAVDALREMLDRSEYKRFINLDGTRNYFMQDNLIEQEQVNGFYQSSENLQEAYRLSKHFNVTEKIEKYGFTDKDRKNSNKYAPLKTVYEVIIPVLHEINSQDNMYIKMGQIEFLENEYPKVVQAYRILGYEKVKELGYNQVKIREAVKQKQEKSSMSGLLEYIEHNFKVGDEISSTANYHRLKQGLRQLNLHHLSPNIRLLRNYCRLSERITIGRDKRGREIKGYRILEVYNTLKD